MLIVKMGCFSHLKHVILTSAKKKTTKCAISLEDIGDEAHKSSANYQKHIMSTVNKNN